MSNVVDRVLMEGGYGHDRGFKSSSLTRPERARRNGEVLEQFAQAPQRLRAAKSSCRERAEWFNVWEVCWQFGAERKDGVEVVRRGKGSAVVSVELESSGRGWVWVGGERQGSSSCAHEPVGKEGT